MKLAEINTVYATMQGNIIDKEIIVESDKVLDDHVLGKTFKKKVDFTKKSHILHITFENCIFEDILLFGVVTPKDQLEKSSVVLKNCYFRDLTIRDTTIEKIEITFNQATIDNFVEEKIKPSIYIINGKINKINIRSESESDTLVPIKTFYFQAFRFQKSDNSNYFFERLAIDNFEIKNSTNVSGVIKLNNLTCSNFAASGVDFGRTLFNNVTIKEAFIKNCAFNECIMNGLVFAEKNFQLKTTYIFEDKLQGKMSNEDTKDTYRQLKHIFDKNSDHIQAARFYSKEMQTYQNIIAEKNIGYEETIIFWLGKNISNFGQSWWRPLWLLIVFETVCWVLHVNLSISPEHFLSFQEWSFSSNMRGVSSWASFFIPLRKISNPDVFETVSCIISTILIYNIAVVVRRKTER